MVRFRPLPETRVANAVPGIVLVAIGVNVLLEGNDVPRPLVWLGIALGIVVAVRGFRMAVAVTDDRVVVRGLVTSRSVPVDAVIGVSDTAIPQLRWRGANAAEHRSPIVALADAWGGLARYAEHNRESLRRLRLEITRRQV